METEPDPPLGLAHRVEDSRPRGAHPDGPRAATGDSGIYIVAREARGQCNAVAQGQQVRDSG